MADERRRGRTGSTEKKRRRSDRWLAAGIVAAAIIAGGVAAHFGTPKAWETSTGASGAGGTSVVDSPSSP